MDGGRIKKKYKVRKYIPGSKEPFPVSRSRVQIFLDCPRCFYIQNRMAIKLPKQFPFNLNSLTDSKLKQSYDFARKKQVPHKHFKENGYNLIPFEHEKIDEWRENFQGLKYHHKKTNLILQGALDDVVQDSTTKELSAIDFKSTATSKERAESVKYLGAPWHSSWKNQLCFYQYLLEKNGFKISKKAFIVFCNGRLDETEWNEKINFDVQLIPYEVDINWIEPTLEKIKNLLEAKHIPTFSNPEACDNCRYILENNSVVSNLIEKDLKFVTTEEAE